MISQVVKIYTKNSTETVCETITNNCESGYSYAECADGTLYSIELSIRSPRDTIYPLYSQVDIEITEDGTTSKLRMIVAKDTFNQITRGVTPVIYKHDLILVEPVKILEKFKFFNINLTNKSNSLSEQFRRLLLNSWTAEKGITLTQDVNIPWKNTPGEDFFFNNSDVRTSADEILQVIGHRCYVDTLVDTNGQYLNEITIKSRPINASVSYTPTWEKDSQGIIEYCEGTNSIDDYAGTIMARGYNSVIKTPITIIDVLKTAENGVVTSENGSLFVPFPIESIDYIDIELNCNVNVSIPAQVGATTWQEYVGTVRIPKQYFCTIDEFNILDTNTRAYSIPYQPGSTEINILGYSFKLLFPIQYNLTNVLNDILSINNFNNNLVEVPTDFASKIFKISYYPRVDTAIEITKPGEYRPLQMASAVIDGQSANTIDIARHGTNLYGKIMQTGNEMKAIDVTASSYRNLMPLFSKLEDGNVCYKRDITMFYRYVKCRYYLTKNYNNIQPNIGVNREKRIFAIPKESTECPIICKRKLVFASEEKTPSSEILGRTFISNTLRTLKYNANSVNAVNYLALNTITHGMDNAYPNAQSAYSLPSVNYAIANQMVFTAKCQDNFSVGFSRQAPEWSLWGDGGCRLTYNAYVDRRNEYIGEFETFGLKMATHSYFENRDALIAQCQNETERLTIAALNQVYPVTLLNHFGWSQSGAFVKNYIKDRTQTPVFSIVIECTSAENDCDKYVIGEKFCSNNELISNQSVRNLKVYYHNDCTKYNAGDKFLKNGAICCKDINGNDMSTEDLISIFNNSSSIILQFTGNGTNMSNYPTNNSVSSWVISDGTNVYFACNSSNMGEYIYVYEE